jgi:hypothetical protein
MLETCVRVDIQKPNVWVPSQDCQTSELCVGGPPHCLTATCNTGDVSCLGAVPRTCNPGRTGWVDAPACETAAHCSTQASQCADGAPCCLPAPCKGGDVRCNNAQLQRCNANETDWDAVDTCKTAELCTQGVAACEGTGSCACPVPVCEIDETRCTDGSLERCNAGRSGWDVVQPCATAALCERSKSRVPLSCEPPSCAPGENRCTETGVLQTCSADLTEFADVATCIGPPFCNAGGGRCEPAPCEAGQLTCNGAQIQVCNPDRTGFDDFGPACETAALCNARGPANVHCDPPFCGVNEVSCLGSNQLETCNGDRTAFQPLGAPCLRPDLCSAERRRCDFCFPGRQECTADLTASRTCALSGNLFGPLTFCPLGCVAATGTCITCAIGSYICQGANILRCDDGRSFTPLNRQSDCSGQTQFTCSNGAAIPRACGAAGCNALRSSCNECAPSSRQCTGDDTFQECSAAGVLGAEQDCDRGEVCEDDGVCVCDDPPCRGGGRNN